VGEGLARDLCLTGRRINANEAHRIGFVSEIAGDGNLMDRAMQIAKIILEAPLATLQYTKGYIAGNSGKGFEESFAIEHDKAFQEFFTKPSRADMIPLSLMAVTHLNSAFHKPIITIIMTSRSMHPYQ
jgi:enoyl-CoA hydratase